MGNADTLRKGQNKHRVVCI